LITQPADGRTRVVIFAANLDLAAGETAASATVTLDDAASNTFQVLAEDVRPVIGTELTQVTFRLTDNLAAGTYTAKISLDGRVSNTGTIRIL
jgi:hypothetical protein